MANKCEKISEKEQKVYDEYQGIIKQYNNYPLPTDVVNRTVEFAERLKSQMEAQNVTKADLARESGASPTTIANLLKGVYERVSEIHIYLFAAILHCSPHYLVGLVDTPAGVCSPDGKEKSLIPFIFASAPEVDFLETMKKAARKDAEFVDYIYQIVEAGPDRMRSVKTILESCNFVTKRGPAPIPNAWKYQAEVENCEN